jgi:excisionase family DNA binding protein
VNVEPHNQLTGTDGSSFTVTEAAELLGMPQTMLSRLCDEGRIPCVGYGTTRRIDAATVHTILHERARIKTAEERRRIRAATAAGPEWSTFPSNRQEL